jgi:hypothetical protein
VKPLAATSLLLLLTACGGSGAVATDGGAPDSSTAPPSLAMLGYLSEVTIYQGVRVQAMKEGYKWPYNAPLYEKRAGLVRVYFTAAQGKRLGNRALEAELHIGYPNGTEKVFTEKKAIGRSSSDDDLASTFNFKLDEDTLVTGSVYRVEVRDPAGVARGDPGATLLYPTETDWDPLEVSPAPGPIKLRIIPVRYDFDGSQRLPDTSQEQIELTKRSLYDMFPATRIDATVRSNPLVWTEEVRPDGAGWGELLQAVLDERAADKPSRDTYYVGAFAPNDSFGEYCMQGCVAGLAPVASPASPADRGVLVLGYAGRYVAETVVHELGHVHGRMHAPCGGAQGIDPMFPYKSGEIGVTGYRLSDSALIPSSSTDVMGYCGPQWVSDYTYRAVGQRITEVNAQGDERGERPPRTFERIVVGKDGKLSWGKAVTLSDDPGGEEVTITVERGGAKTSLVGRFVGYDHLPGGWVLVPSGFALTDARARVFVPSLSASPVVARAPAR